MGVRTIKTIQNNQTNKCPLSKDAVKKSERGTFGYKSDGDILVCVWKDGNVATIASNFDTVLPIDSCFRYSESKKKKAFHNKT